jgi:hypothetical protein
MRAVVLGAILPWNMHITDEQHRLLFTLQLGEVPSGELLFIPHAMK